MRTGYALAPGDARPSVDAGALDGSLRLDGRLDEVSREQVECHLADCEYCPALVSLLCRMRDTAAISEPVPDELLAQARALVTREPPRRWRLAPQWAAAATLVLAVPLLLLIGRNLDRGVCPLRPAVWSLQNA